jgi:hypothetical protein
MGDGVCVDCYIDTVRTMRAEHRNDLGRMVREEWIAWATEQADIAEHPHWLTSWDELPERDKEVDRRIGERLYNAGRVAAKEEDAE